MEGEEQKVVKQEKSSTVQNKNRFNTGMIKFKPTFTQRIKQKYLSSEMRQFINKQKWQWQPGEQRDDALIAILAYIEKANCQSVVLRPSFDQQYTFLTSIVSISFPQLLRLDLKSNNLTSIQPLDSLNCPQLQYINLSHNCIICIKPLNKIKFPNLKELFIHHNRFSHIQLAKICLLSDQQTFLSLFLSGSLQGNLFKQRHRNPTFVNDIRSLSMKLQTPSSNKGIFAQTFYFQVYAPVFTQKLKLQLAKKVAEKFCTHDFQKQSFLQELDQQAKRLSSRAPRAPRQPRGGPGATVNRLDPSIYKRWKK